jgi:hypothetical protein
VTPPVLTLLRVSIPTTLVAGHYCAGVALGDEIGHERGLPGSASQLTVLDTGSRPMIEPRAQEIPGRLAERTGVVHYYMQLATIVP